MPFCFQGLAPPPRTSARVLVLWVPERRAASWAVTTWCMHGDVGLDAEDGVVELDRAGVAAGTLLDRDRGHQAFTSAVAGGQLHGVADDDDAALGAGHGALHEQQALLGVGLDDLEVQGGDLLAAHATGHAGALEDAGRRGAGADRAGRPVDAVGAVRGLLAAEVVALHDAGEALALAHGGDVDEVAGGEQCRP